MSRGGSSGHGGSGGARGGGGGHSGGSRGSGFSGGAGRGGFHGLGPGGGHGGPDEEHHGGPGLFDYYVPMYWYGSYMGIEVFLMILVIIAIILAYIFTYKSSITDPIENIKQIFMNAHLGLITVLLGLTLLAKSYSKTEGILIRRLLVIFCLLTITLIGFYATRLSWDQTYTESTFRSSYFTSNDVDKVSEDYYVKECTKLYLFFKVKTYGTIILNFICVILLGAQIIRAIYVQGQKDKMNKDDKIIFDEEINCRY